MAKAKNSTATPPDHRSLSFSTDLSVLIRPSRRRFCCALLASLFTPFGALRQKGTVLVRTAGWNCRRAAARRQSPRGQRAQERRKKKTPRGLVARLVHRRRRRPSPFLSFCFCLSLSLSLSLSLPRFLSHSQHQRLTGSGVRVRPGADDDGARAARDRDGAVRRRRAGGDADRRRRRGRRGPAGGRPLAARGGGGRGKRGGRGERRAEGGEHCTCVCVWGGGSEEEKGGDGGGEMSFRWFGIEKTRVGRGKARPEEKKKFFIVHFFRDGLLGR